MAEQNRHAREDHLTELHTAEAVSRRDESRANVFRGRANRIGEQYKAPSEAASRDALASAQAVEDLRGAAPAVDKEGTPPALADRSGNFAANAEVAAAGGIGVDSSNTNVATGQPAATADEAGGKADADPADGHGGKAAAAPARAAGSSSPETDLIVGKGPRGKFYVKRGKELVDGPFETEDEAKAAVPAAAAAANSEGTA